MRPITTPTMPGLVPASASRHATRRTQAGELEAVYVDTATDEPAFVTVKVGIVGRHRLAFVPVTGATVTRTTVRVQYPKKLIQNAPSIGTDGELTGAEEPAVFAHYDLPYTAATPGERRLGRR